MTTTEATTAHPAAVAAAADQIADRLRTKTIDQVVAIGERTGWWNAELVDWVADGRNGPPPDSAVKPITPRERDEERLNELQQQLSDAGTVLPDDAATEPAPELDLAPDAPTDVAAPVAEASTDVSRPVVPPTNGSVASSAYIAVVQARDFGVDHTYQRPLDEPRVRRMVKDWDPRMVGVLDVSDRGPEHQPRYAVINGQHRAAAAARVSPAGADVWLACNVHEGLTVADEAALMHELDRTTKKLTGWDKWRARRAAGDPAVLTVEQIAARHGLQVEDALTDGALRSYGSAEKLLARGGEELLGTTLGVLHGAYGAANAGYQAPLLTGVGTLLQVYGASVDLERLTRALASTRPEQLRASATAFRDMDGGALHELMTRAIIGQYNRTPGPGTRLGGRS